MKPSIPSPHALALTAARRRHQELLQLLSDRLGIAIPRGTYDHPHALGAISAELDRRGIS